MYLRIDVNSDKPFNFQNVELQLNTLYYYCQKTSGPPNISSLGGSESNINMRGVHDDNVCRGLIFLDPRPSTYIPARPPFPLWNENRKCGVSFNEMKFFANF